MEYIYHAVPKNLDESILYPLFSLKNKCPDLYEKEIKKYDDHPQRRLLPFKKVPKLNCSRGDVLHFSPIHPNLIFKALKSVFSDWNRSVQFFKIPIIRAQNCEIAYFDMNRQGYEFGKDEPDHIFDLLTPAEYKELKSVPPEAIQFYQEWKNKGEAGAPAWGKIPHIFVKGSVNIDGCEIIDWRDNLK